MLVLIATLAARTAAQPTTPKERPSSYCRIRHIGVSGNLDTMRVAREIESRIQQASKAQVDSIVIELSGNKWRPDVVHAIAGSLRAATVRTNIWLRRSKDGSVGVGQAVLGLIATECWIEPGTEIAGSSDGDCLDLSPKGTNHAKLIQELMRWAGERRDIRDFDPLLPRLLLGPPTALWAVGDQPTGRLRITPIDPASERQAPARAFALSRPKPGAPADLSISSEVAADLHLALGEATYMINLFEHRGLKPDSSLPLPIVVDLNQILGNATKSLDALDRELESIETVLGAKPRDQRINTQNFYRDLGDKVLKRTSKAREQLDACEETLVDDPEIARTPPPGASRVGAPDTHATAWRRTFQKRRDLIARLEKRARGFAAR